MKKKLLALALTTAMLGSCMIAVPVQAENLFKWGDVTYDLDTGTVTKCETTASGSVSIPAKIKGTAVTSIGANAFKDCSRITSITIPNSVTSIGNYAFSGCEKLNAVHISDIAAWCTISFGVYSSNPLGYAHNLYLNNDLITELVIPDSVTSIGDCAFDGCDGLTSITIPGSVTSIGNSAFSDCTGLTSVTIPNSVTSIGDWAFSLCTGLTSITIPDSVTSIGDEAFSFCDRLTSITIPDGVTSIGINTFDSCSSLTSITIPDSVTTIGEGAFSGCGLTSVTIPDSVTYIGDGAFSDCSSLTSVTIPDSVTYIGRYAFMQCSSLTSINVSGNNNAYTSKDGVLFDKDMETIICCPCGKTGEYAIPDSVTSIGSYAFCYCDSLTSITIPDSVTTIGDYAFCGCSELANIYYTGTSAQWIQVDKGSDWKSYCPAKIYVLAPTIKSATVNSDKTYAYRSLIGSGTTGFSATIEADETPYVLGDVIWSVTSNGVSKSTKALSYGNIRISSGAVCIGLVVRGLYDPYATATATYEKIVSDYTEYIE